jgi:transketolase
MNVEALEDKARMMRGEAIKMLFSAQSGHPGSAMSVMDVLTALYFGFEESSDELRVGAGVLRHDSNNSNDPKRDRFLLSNGHACPALYVVLAEAGYFDKAELAELRQLGARVQGHPHRGSLPGVEISSGSLGQGLSVGIGLAYALRLKQSDSMVYVMMSDGEQEEGSLWEAIMYAPKKKLNNLVAIVDKNKFQIDGATKEVMPGLDSLADKYRAFNWDVQEIDGHNFNEILPALMKAKRVNGPAVIISNTVRGKGVSFMEGSEHWHAGAMTEEEYEQAMKDLL